jgi:hypothetical protein
MWWRTVYGTVIHGDYEQLTAWCFGKELLSPDGERLAWGEAELRRARRDYASFIPIKGDGFNGEDYPGGWRRVKEYSAAA